MEYIQFISHRDLILKMRSIPLTGTCSRKWQSIPLTGISSLRSDIPQPPAAGWANQKRKSTIE